MVGGILSDPLDDPSGPRRRRQEYPKQAAERGLTVRHRTSGCIGDIIKFSDTVVTLKDRKGREQVIPVADGAFSVGGITVTLVRPAPKPKSSTTTTTASGSVAATDRRARVARASRILVEGIHDAELVEKVWGDDLRAEGVVVEPLHGADDLAAITEAFEPGPERRLGVLLDHLVDHSKESRIAAEIDHPSVLITGHPFVDIWQAIRPEVIGIEAWPVIERGTDWKTGMCAALGFSGKPGELWPRLLGRVGSYRDLEPGLIGAVEQLIDFVAPPPPE